MISYGFLGVGISVIGLTITGWGALIASRAMIISKDDALKIGVARWASDTEEKNLLLPSVQNLIRQSRASSNGLKLVMVGSGLQIVGAITSYLNS